MSEHTIEDYKKAALILKKKLLQVDERYQKLKKKYYIKKGLIEKN